MTTAQPPRRDVADRLLAPVAVGEANASERATVDVGALVRRLLLFDLVILDSYGLQEFPQLIDTFGVDGLRNILEADVLKVRIDAIVFSQAGQSMDLTEERRRDGPLPLGSYEFIALRGADAKQHTSLRLGVIRSYLGQSKGGAEAETGRSTQRHS